MGSLHHLLLFGLQRSTSGLFFLSLFFLFSYNLSTLHLYKCVLQAQNEAHLNEFPLVFIVGYLMEFMHRRLSQSVRLRNLHVLLMAVRMMGVGSNNINSLL